VSALSDMTDEEAFAWLRDRVPSARGIEVTYDALTSETVVWLQAAREDEAKRLRRSFGLMLMPWMRVEVR
jgi:hypothetical protein